MLRLSMILAVLVGCVTAWSEDDPDAPKVAPADETTLQAIPKVPTLATIIADGNPKLATSKWVQELMKKKETKARVEIVLLKQKLIADQEAQSAEDRERARRKLAYDKAHGTLFDTGPAAPDAHKKSIKMKLEFQVAEIESYKRLIALHRQRSALALSIVESLTKLDRDNDGKLSGDEYRDAACIFIASQRLFASIDNDGDGLISFAELEAAKALPADGAAALLAGSGSKDAVSGGLLIKGFDVDKDGVLTIAERKALSSAYLEVELRSAQEADAYQRLLDDLTTARQTTAAKFENLVIDIVEPK